MARPVLAAKGTVSVVTTNAPAPTYPTGVVANDILVIEVVKQDGTSSPTISTPTGWTLLDSVQQLDASFNAIGRISWFWIRTTGTLSGTLTLATTGATGNSTVAAAQIYRITGCRTSGNPFDNFRSGVNSSQVSWQGDIASSGALHIWHAAEELTLCFAAGSGAGQTQPPVAPTGTQAISGIPADSSTSGADAFTLVYAVITEAEPSVGPYTSSTTRFGAGTLFINFVSASYVGQSLKSGTDTGSGADLGVGPKIIVSEGGPVAGNSAKFAGTAINDTTSTGTANWTNASNVTADDGVAASLTINTETSKDLLSSNFGFAIPTNATITGIVLEIGDFTASSIVSDLVVALSKNSSTLAGSNKATGLAIFSGTLTYGSATDLWGTTWTPAEINDSLFSAIFQITTGNASFVTVDFIRVTVYYTTVLSAATITENGTQSTSGGSTPKSGTDVNGTTTEDTTELGVFSQVDVNGATTESGLPLGVHTAADSNGETEASVLNAVFTQTDVNGVTTENGVQSQALLGTDTNGATTEATTEIAQYSQADVNGSTEASVEAAKFTQTDANGTTTENALEIITPSADTNTTVDASQIVARMTGSDVNGADTENAAEVSIATVSDTNGSSETTAMTAAETGTDSGASSENGNPSLSLSGSDSNGSSDTATLKAAYTITDFNGSGENTILGVVLPVSDANATSTDQGSLALNYILTDANGATTEANTLVAKITTTEINSETDSGSVSTGGSPVFGADTGSGSEISSVTAVFTQTDTNSESEASILAAKPIGTDAAGATESTAQGRLGSEAGSGLETASESVLYVLADSGISVEAAIEAVQSVVTEIGVSIDSSLISVTVLGADSATDLENGIKGYTVADFGVGFDNAPTANDNAFTVTDLGSGGDTAQTVKWPYFPDEPPEILVASESEPAVLVSAGLPAAELVATQDETPEAEIRTLQKPSITRVGSDKPKIERIT